MIALGERITGWLIACRLPLLALAALVIPIAYPLSTQLSLDRSIENMFAPDDPLLAPYRQLQDLFGASDAVLAVYDDPQLLNTNGSGIRRLSAVSRRLAAVPGVKDTLSLARFDRILTQLSPPRVSGLFRRRKPRLGTSITDPNNRLGREFLEIFAGYTYGADKRTVAVVCLLEPVSTASASRRETVTELNRVMEELPAQLAPAMIIGQPVMVVEGFDLIERDGHLLGRATTLLLGITIVLCFRSLRWVLIPLIVVGWTVLVTRAVLAACGLEMSMVSSMLAAIVTVVGVATVVHVTLRYRAARDEQLPRREALLQAGGLLVAPIFFTCVTDALGFAALMIAQVGPVRDFGLMMAIGSLMVLVAVALIVPGLVLWGRRDVDPQHAWGKDRLDRTLHALIDWTEQRPRALGLGLVCLFAIALSGVLRADVETDFTRNFRADHPLVLSYAFVEERLGGAGVWDILIPAPQQLDDEFVKRVRDFQQRLRAIDISVPGQSSAADPADAEREPTATGALTKVVSLIDAIDAAESSYTLSLVPVSIREQKLREVLPGFVQALKTDNPTQDSCFARIMLRAHERQPAEQKLRLIDAVHRAAQDEFPADSDTPVAEVTGPFVLMAHLISSLIRDQWICFAAAIVGIGVALWFAFRDLPLVAIALVPNMLPILIVLGGLGWLDIKINMGAAMIAAAAMGLSIDSSIHYISSFQRGRQAGHDLPAAIRDAQTSVGPAIVFSTLALVVGFLALCTSQFVPTVYFGILGSLSLLGGLMGNLVVLPLLLRQLSARPS